MATINDVKAGVDEFFSLIKGSKLPPCHEIGILNAQDKTFLKNVEWAPNAGVYFFFKNNELKYVGRALIPTGLANRVFDQATAFDDPKWDDVIKDTNSTVCVFPLPTSDWFWAASLEAFLIDKFRPSLVNRRSS